MEKTGPALIRYLETLIMAGGDHDGAPFEVLPWEARFVRGAFRVRGPAALSVARGNGKSALVAGIATAVVDPDGPLHGRRREAVCVASSFDQSRIIFEDVLSFLRERHDLGDKKLWRRQDSGNRATVEWLATGARVRCVGSDPKKAHGLRPALALLDEPAQWDAAKSDRMLAAIKTGMGKVPRSKLVALGTRPANPDHWFARMLAGEAHYAQSHAARPRDPVFHRRTWKRANPSLDHLPSLEVEIRDEAELARQDPAMLASFKALRLNMGVADHEQRTLLDAGTWERVEGNADREGRPIWGLDLGTSAAMSAAAAYWPATGLLEVLAAFPTEPGLPERGLRDGVGRLYAECARRGELIQCGEHIVDIAELLRAALNRFGSPAKIVTDTWREAELRESLKKASVPVVPLIVRRQGIKDGSEDVRTFRRAILEGRVTPRRSLLLTSAMAEARTAPPDDAGNEKLSKGTQGGRRLRARDDAAAAAVLAVAIGDREARKPQRGIYIGAL